MSWCGTRSPTKCITGPSASARVRVPARTPPSAPVATWRETINATRPVWPAEQRRLPTPSPQQLPPGWPSRAKRLANPGRDRLHLERRAGHFLEQLLGRPALPLGPQLAQERSGLAPGEPGLTELLAQELAQLRLERPRAQVCGDVEAGVDVAEVVRRARLDLQRVAEDLDVAQPHRRHFVGAVELEFVQDLAAIAAHEVQEARRAFEREVVRARKVEP